MRKSLLIGMALASATAGAPVQASTPTITIINGVYTLPAFTTASVFQSFETAPVNDAYVPRPTEAVTGDVVVRQNTIPGETVDPDSSSSNRYLSIEGGSYSVALGTPVQFFSFILGSLDSYNALTLNFADGTSTVFSGRQIIGDTTVGPFNSGTSGRVSYDLGGQAGITSATFTSSQSAFEIDALASAVPEPATWAMMMAGFGLIGGAARRRRRVNTNVRFA